MEKKYNFTKLENKINIELENNYHGLIGNDDRVKYYDSQFDRTIEEGFYKANGPRKGEGEVPNWEPNPAYMNSLEELWTGIPEIFGEYDLALEKSLRELFFESREYRDYTAIHRRVFIAQLVSSSNNKAVTICMLTVPHSHDKFEYIAQPTVHISKFLSV